MNNDNNENKSLFDELEEVRALFEETLKKEKEKAESSPQAEAEADPSLNTESAEKDSDTDSPACSRCGEKLSEKDLADNGEYCESCRKAMLRTPIKLRGLVAIIVAAVIFFGSMITSMDSIMSFTDPDSTEYEDFFEGYIAYSENRLISAASYYGSYLYKRQGSKNISSSALTQLIDAYCKMGEYPYAAQIIEDYYSSFELKLPWNGKYRKIIEKNELNGETYTAIIEIVKNSYSDGGYDYEAAVKKMQELKNQKNDEGKALYSSYVIDIFSFDFTATFEDDLQVLYEMIKKIDEDYGDEERDHIPVLCRYAALCGDRETADKCYERMMKINSQNMSIYSAYFNSFRYTENPDTEKMLEICHKMSAVSGELYECNRYNSDYLYYYAIAYMLQGDAGELPFTLMQELYDSINLYGQYYEGNTRASDIFNLYALAALYTGNTEAYDWAKQEIEYLGGKLGDSIIAYENDEISLKEVLTDVKGDIA